MTMQPLADLNQLRAELPHQPTPDLLEYYQQGETLIARLQTYLYTEDPAESESLLRDLRALGTPVLPPLDSTRRLQVFFCNAARHVEHVASVGACERIADCGDDNLPEQIHDIPGMDGDDSLLYYYWLARRLEYWGDIVEIGCWFGQSTSALASGMVSGAYGRATETPTIRVYDSFRWESWMDNYVSPSDHRKFGQLIPRQVGTDFLPAFRVFTSTFRKHIRPYRTNMEQRDSRILDPPDRPIELLVYDMGPDLTTLNEFWERFSPQLVPGRSWIVFNEYGSVRSRIIWEFCRGRHDLVPAHKPPGTLKSFRYSR